MLLEVLLEALLAHCPRANPHYLVVSLLQMKEVSKKVTYLMRLLCATGPLYNWVYLIQLKLGIVVQS